MRPNVYRYVRTVALGERPFHLMVFPSLRVARRKTFSSGFHSEVLISEGAEKM